MGNRDPRWRAVVAPHRSREGLARPDPLEQIAVDFHIIGITNKLSERDFDQYDEDDLETLRNYWQIPCKNTDSSLSKSTSHSR